MMMSTESLICSRFANLLAYIEEYARAFIYNSERFGNVSNRSIIVHDLCQSIFVSLILFKIIHLPIDSARNIVHRYRSTIASRYNLTVESFPSSDEEKSTSTSLHQSGRLNKDY